MSNGDSLLHDVIDRCKRAGFTGVVFVRSDEGLGQISFVAGVIDESRIGTVTGDAALAKLRGMKGVTIDVHVRLPESKGLPVAFEGGLNEHVPVEIFRYCEDHALTCVVELHSGGIKGVANYILGELTDVSCGGDSRDIAVTNMIGWKDGTYRIVLPGVDLPAGVSYQVPKLRDEGGRPSVMPKAALPSAPPEAPAVDPIKAAEAARAEEARKAEEAHKLAEARKAAETRRAEDARRADEAKRKIEEVRRAAEAKRQAEEAARAEAEKKKAEAAKPAAETAKPAAEAAPKLEEPKKSEVPKRAHVEAEIAEEARKAKAAKKAAKAAKAEEEKRAAREADAEEARARAEEQRALAKKSAGKVEAASSEAKPVAEEPKRKASSAPPAPPKKSALPLILFVIIAIAAAAVAYMKFMRK